MNDYYRTNNIYFIYSFKFYFNIKDELKLLYFFPQEKTAINIQK